MFDHQPFEDLDGDVADFSVLLERRSHLPQEQAHQEVVPAEVIGQGVVQLEICSGGALASCKVSTQHSFPFIS